MDWGAIGRAAPAGVVLGDAVSAGLDGHWARCALRLFAYGVWLVALLQPSDDPATKPLPVPP